MFHHFFLIILGTLTLLNFSPCSLAAGAEESKENGTPQKTVRTEESQELHKGIDIDDDPFNLFISNIDSLNDYLDQDELLNAPSENGPPQKVVKAEVVQEQETFSPLASLTLPLFQRVGEFLSPYDVVQLAQVSKYCLKSVSSHLNLELSLENRILTEEDFINRFGENGFYKEAQCLSLSGSSFHPVWLKHLPKTLRALKLRQINTPGFSQYGFEDRSTMKIQILKALNGKALPKLKFLDISENALGAPEAVAIAQDLTSLRSLNISWNRIEFEGAQHIAKHLTSLTTLFISNNWIGDEGARLIAENLKFLNRLNIYKNNIGSEGAEYIAKNLKSLTFLNISDNDIGTEGAEYIGWYQKSLTFLNISDNEIGTKGAEYIAKNLTSLTSLNISDNEIGVEGTEYIAKNLKFLTYLTISWNQIGYKGAQHIAENLKFLTYLDISNNKIEDEGVCCIVEYLKFLTYLDINDNQIGSAGARLIAENLKSLTYLDISSNWIGTVGARYLAQLPALSTLHISGNPINENEDEVKQGLREQLPWCKIYF